MFHVPLGKVVPVISSMYGVPCPYIFSSLSWYIILSCGRGLFCSWALDGGVGGACSARVHFVYLLCVVVWFALWWALWNRQYCGLSGFVLLRLAIKVVQPGVLHLVDLGLVGLGSNLWLW